MTIGYEPKMKVELHATDSDEYAFKGGYQSSNVTVKGGTYVSASRSGSDTLYVTFKFKPIKGTYSSPDDAYWTAAPAGVRLTMRLTPMTSIYTAEVRL